MFRRLVRTPVISFEERLRRDTLSAILLLEVTVVLAAAFLAAALLRQHPAITATLGIAAISTLTYLLLHEAGREARRLALAEVRSLKQLGLDSPFLLPWTPMFSLSWSGYIVEVVAADVGRLVFLDWRPRRVGEKLLILMDRSGNVLAVNSLKKPLSIETLRRLA